MTAVIRTEGLTKRYGRVLAVDGVDLDVQAGDRYGFLGPNGSGKTTTVRMLLGLVHPTAGRIELFGQRMPKAVHTALPHVGALVEGPAFVPHLPGRTNLSLIDQAGPGGSGRTRRRRINEVLEQVRLADVDSRPVKAYSLGMKQRLGVAAALLRRPRLLVLDEPTNGLDPAGIREIRDLLIKLNEEGTTVFLSSHLLAEVEQLCSRAAIVHQGRLVAQERVDALLVPTGRVRITTADSAAARSVLGTLRGPELLDADGARLVVHLDGMRPAELNAHLVAAGVAVDELIVERPNLEDIFLALTGERVADADLAAEVEGPGDVRG
jgi:ABC-type multidrug transport system ATPase subunit